MFQESAQGAGASNLPPARENHEGHFEPIRHMVFGAPATVAATIKLLHKLHYAEPTDWSLPIPTGRPNEVMVILTKRVRVD